MHIGEGNLSDRNQLEKLGVDGRVILKCIIRKWDGGKDWIALAQAKDRSRAVVNVVMNRYHKMQRVA